MFLEYAYLIQFCFSRMMVTNKIQADFADLHMGVVFQYLIDSSFITHILFIPAISDIGQIARMIAARWHYHVWISLVQLQYHVE